VTSTPVVANQDKDDQEPKDEQKKDRDDYTSLSSNLQKITLVFFGFIIFVTYILIPYYSQADEYKNNKNILFYVDQIYDNFSAIKAILSNYTADNETIKKYQTDLDHSSDAYSIIYPQLSVVYKKYTSTSVPPQEQFQNIFNNISNSYHLTTYPVCNKQPDFGKWFTCNTHENNILAAKRIFIVVNSTITNEINDKINNIPPLIRNIEIHNNVTSLVNATSIKSWNKIVSDWKKYPMISTSAKLDLASLNKYKEEGYFFPSFKRNEANLTTKIDNRIKEYISKMDTIEYPIVGRVPIISLNLTFLSFPFIIAAGFSFLSFQFKKLIKLSKKLEQDNNSDELELFRSWIDPLKSFPEKIYSLLVIFTPCAIFVILFCLITITWYHEEPYMMTSLSHDVLFISIVDKHVFLILNSIGIVIFEISYIQIFSAWGSRLNKPS